jgi:hypothetical protein
MLSYQLFQTCVCVSVDRRASFNIAVRAATGSGNSASAAAGHGGAPGRSSGEVVQQAPALTAMALNAPAAGRADAGGGGGFADDGLGLSGFSSGNSAAQFARMASSALATCGTVAASPAQLTTHRNGACRSLSLPRGLSAWLPLLRPQPRASGSPCANGPRPVASPQASVGPCEDHPRPFLPVCALCSDCRPEHEQGAEHVPGGARGLPSHGGGLPHAGPVALVPGARIAASTECLVEAQSSIREGEHAGAAASEPSLCGVFAGS